MQAAMGNVLRSADSSGAGPTLASSFSPFTASISILSAMMGVVWGEREEMEGMVLSCALAA